MGYVLWSDEDDGAAPAPGAWHEREDHVPGEPDPSLAAWEEFCGWCRLLWWALALMLGVLCALIGFRWLS